MTNPKCKICGSERLEVFLHTAKCRDCGVLLYYPYPKKKHRVEYPDKASAIKWYLQAAKYNHTNFTNVVNYSINDADKNKKIKILDYGGGGGQFALISKSLYFNSEIYITDISDDALLSEWEPLNNQIKYDEFIEDRNKFDYIFMNDVFEHLKDPLETLQMLASKLSDGGKVFIDTPKQFIIYQIAKIFSKKLYEKILIGTVSEAHLQIWSKKSFELVINNAGLAVHKYSEISEYTMPPHYYLDNMNISNPVIRMMGHIFYRMSRFLVKNKILCVLIPINS